MVIVAESRADCQSKSRQTQANGLVAVYKRVATVALTHSEGLP
jgi:hypothetical protein